MRKRLLVFCLVCSIGSVTGCGAMNAAFNSKLETDSLLRVIDLDQQTTADKMKRACRNAVPQVSSDLHELKTSNSPDLIAFSNTSANDFFYGTGDEYQLAIKCRLLASKKHIHSIYIDAFEKGLPGSLKLKQLKDNFEQMVGHVYTELRLNSGGGVR